MKDDLEEKYFKARFEEIYGTRKAFTKRRCLTILYSILMEARRDDIERSMEVYERCLEYVDEMEWS